MDDRLFDDQHQSFDDVGQLPYIAGPGLIFKEIPDFGVKGMGFMVADIQALQQRLGNLLDIAFPFAQRRDFDRQDGQAIIEVQPEMSFLDFTGQVLIGRRNDPDVDRHAALAANRPDILLLKDPQQPVLQNIGHVADFIKEQGAAISRFKEADFAIPVGPGKGPANISKELTFQ